MAKTARSGSALGRELRRQQQYPGAETRRPSEGAQVGGSDDRLAAYLGGVEYPLDASPIWTWMGQDALKGPEVKAVEEFRKAVAEGEKAEKPEAATGTGTGPEAEREWNVDAKQAVE